MVSGKEFRIITLLVIDVVFFFVEIITGYAVGSLALVADSFHMLNDVMSLIVALYAVKVSSQPPRQTFPQKMTADPDSLPFGSSPQKTRTTASPTAGNEQRSSVP